MLRRSAERDGRNIIVVRDKFLVGGKQRLMAIPAAALNAIPIRPRKDVTFEDNNRAPIQPYIANILLNENFIPEMLQHRATPNLLSKQACEIIKDKKYSKKIESKFNKLHNALKRNTSSLIFEIIKPYLK